MDASSILAIPLNEPERLFNFKEHLRTDFKALAKLWHPDVCKETNAKKVFAHIHALYENARVKITSGCWEPFGCLEVRGKPHKFVRIMYKAKREFELGTMYIGETLVSFKIDKKHEKLVRQGLRAIGTIRYPNEEFRQSLEQYFPKVEHFVECNDFYLVSMRKDKKEILLADLIEHMGGIVDPKHVCWFMSSLFNLCCFMQICKITHNGLTADTIFVNPERHTISIYGGWWYAVEFGKAISTLPPATFKLAPRSLIVNKRAIAFLDLECVRAIGRFALGDATGSTLRMNDEVIPKPMANFLMLPPTNSALKEYESWMEVLKKQGPRKFVPLHVTAEDVYPPQES